MIHPPHVVQPCKNPKYNIHIYLLDGYSYQNQHCSAEWYNERSGGAGNLLWLGTRTFKDMCLGHHHSYGKFMNGEKKKVPREGYSENLRP